MRGLPVLHVDLNHEVHLNNITSKVQFKTYRKNPVSMPDLRLSRYYEFCHLVGCDFSYCSWNLHTLCLKPGHIYTRLYGANSLKIVICTVFSLQRQAFDNDYGTNRCFFFSLGFFRNIGKTSENKCYNVWCMRISHWCLRGWSLMSFVSAWYS
jgi:hypothetical protein